MSDRVRRFHFTNATHGLINAEVKAARYWLEELKLSAVRT
jgi:hypothetical protein